MDKEELRHSVIVIGYSLSKNTMLLYNYCRRWGGEENVCEETNREHSKGSSSAFPTSNVQ